MKRRDLERALKAMGYTHVGGSKHDRWVNKSGSYTATVPRHNEVEEVFFSLGGVFKLKERHPAVLGSR